MTDSIEWEPPECGEDEDYIEYLGRAADHFTTNPPPAPKGFVLIECDAQPRHWPCYEYETSDFYPAPCPQCVVDGYQQSADERARRHHWIDHPIRGRWADRILRQLRKIGVIASYGTAFGGVTQCRDCVINIRLRGHRRYILGHDRDQWEESR